MHGIHLSLYGSEPLPTVPLHMGDAPCDSPIEFNDSDDNAVTVPNGDDSLRKKSKDSRACMVLRRYTTEEFATSCRDRYRYQRREQSDRSDILLDKGAPSTLSRPSSTSVGIMRRLTRKGTAVARSLSFHSHLNGGVDSPRDMPVLSKNRGSTAITSVTFIHSFSRKNDPRASPCLWIGTNAGDSIALNLILPQDRLTSTVVVAPSGTVVKLKGHVLFQCFMDHSFCLASAASESYRENCKESKDCGSPEKAINNRVVTKSSLSPTYSVSSDSSEDVPQSLIVVAEFEVKVIALPSFSQLFIHKCEEVPLVKAHATHVSGYPVLMCLAADGKIVVLSLPSLRLLYHVPLLPYSVDIDDPICQRISFSEHGLGVYMASPSEVEKYTICAEIAEQATDSLGELFVACDLPDPPRNNSSFLKGVSNMFSGIQRQESCDVDSILADREKNSGGVGGGATRAVARTIPGPSVNMERTQSSGVSAGQAALAALQNISERGEKLSATVDASENLRNSAMNLSQRTGKLVEKLEKKKWYNF
ncbi:hypothetical protein KIN20_002471 [Parelaphostrongylus tenuis]|uniref:V-SNARE coiled-coil homology domain-containing protein n=1 Tax=Parelaphostrongylus tenuis TaxID=148309 RepID=A0AAD5MGP3_PARTN|nr:hypothetical protein KIN20_002471 [Parelaphostrongylus tenuis]